MSPRFGGHASHPELVASVRAFALSALLGAAACVGTGESPMEDARARRYAVRYVESIRVESEPPGAAIYVDDVYVGEGGTQEELRLTTRIDLQGRVRDPVKPVLGGDVLAISMISDPSLW